MVMKVFSRFIHIAVLSCAVRTIQSAACGNGWDMQDGSCFKFIPCNGACSVNSTQSECRQKQGANLAKVSSSQRQNYIQNELNGQTEFGILGGIYGESGWRWRDGSTMGSYSHWETGESRPAKNKCMFMAVLDGQWMHTPCNKEFTGQENAYYICEKST